MALAQVTNYTTLVAYLPEYFENDETHFTDNLDAWIGLAEAGGNRALLSRQMETTTTLTTDADGFVALPAGFLAARSVAVDDSVGIDLNFIGGDAVTAFFPVRSAGGEPNSITISGTGLTIYPAKERDLTFRYYGKFAGLTSLNLTNWLIDQHPDWYVAAVSEKAAGHLKDWDEAARQAGIKNGIEAEILNQFAIQYYYNAGTTLEGDTP